MNLTCAGTHLSNIRVEVLLIKLSLEHVSHVGIQNLKGYLS